jgi:adenine-specific DNA-methyltransferase
MNAAAQYSLFSENIVDENPKYLTDQVVTYIGNKRKLLSFIGKGIDFARTELEKPKISFLDLFSGSGIVSRFAKKSSSLIIANDLELYSQIVNRCYLSNSQEIDRNQLLSLVKDIHHSAISNLAPGFIAEMYSPMDEENIQPGERVFYTRRNAMYLDTVRKLVDGCPDLYRDHILGPLMSAASVNTNTSGVFKGFYKNKDSIGQYGGTARNALTRIMKEITLEPPVRSNYDCDYQVTQLDANVAVRDLPHVDIAYFDPPYNQHPYGSNYFMLNLLAKYVRPIDISKVSGIPEDWNRSDYNKRQRAEPALFDAVENCKANFILISYNSEGFIPHENFLRELQLCGEVSVMDTEYNTFRGCRNLRNRDTYVTEFLYLVDKRGLRHGSQG